MKSLVVVLGLVACALAFVHAATQQGTVGLAPFTPQLVAVDPYANPDKANPLNPERPYWYAAGASGLTVMKLTDNTVLGTVAWPATYDLAYPDGTMKNVPAPRLADGDGTALNWEPVRLMLPSPGGEDIGPEAVEGATTLAFVIMAHSGYEWQSSIRADGQRFRDTIAANTNPEFESSLLLMVDVSDPAHPVIHAGALLGHEATQMAWDPNGGAMYVANMPSESLPPELASFVSKITPPEAGAEPAPPYSPNTFYPLCGPEIQWSGEAKVVEKTGIPVNEPEVWACDALHGAGEGEGPFTYKFDGLPPWLIAHGLDSTTGEADGILYGTPTEVGTYSFMVTVTDHAPEADGVTAPKTASAVFTIDVKAAVTEFAAGEMEVEAGITTALPLWGTGTCDTVRGTTPVPAWFEVVPVVGGCIVLMNNPPLQGEYYDFSMPNLTRIDTRTGQAYPGPWRLSAEVLGTYGFDSLPPGVGLTGLAWHEVDMIPGEPDKYVLNGEFIGVATNGQLYKIALPYEESDTIEEIGPPSMVIETNEVTLIGVLPGSGFGNVVVEADRDIYVAADGSVIKVNIRPGTPDTINASTISLPLGMQASYLALDSDLEPAVKPDLGGLGQFDHNVLWVTGTSSGDVAAIDTDAGTVQTLITGASALGGVAVDSVSTGLAYVALPSAGSVVLFGSGTAWNSAPLMATINPAEAIVDPTVMTIGEPGEVTIVATGWPIPIVSVTGILPAGLSTTSNADGTLTISGTPTVAGVYSLTATAANGVLPEGTQAFTLTVEALAPPAITSVNTATLPVGIASQFKVEATGTPTPILTVSGALPDGVTFHDNAACSPAIPVGCTGSAFLGGLPTSSTGSPYKLTITASNSQGSVTQEFTLNLEAPGMTEAPIITTHPASQSATDGQMVTFMSYATGTPTPTVQWQVSTDGGATWSVIAGATNAIYTTQATSAINGYQYRAVFTNAIGSTPTLAAILTLVSSGQTVINVAPAVLSFTYNADTTPAAQTVSVATGTTSMPYTVTTSASWLTATAASGTTPSTVNISVNTSGFVAGSYSGTVTVSSAGLANSPLTIPVAVIEKDSGADFTFMVGVGSAPESIALDRSTHHLFIGEMSEGIETGLENPGGPEVLPVPSPVFHVDPSVPKVLGHTTVNSSGEYLAVNSTTRLLYVANEVTNEIAVINADTNAVVGYIPLVYEGGSYMPYQIAIDEAQNLIYVGTRAPEPADPVLTDGKFSCKAIHEMPEDTYECWNPGKVFVIDGITNALALNSEGKPMFFPAGSDPEGVVFAAPTGRVYASNEDDGTITVAQGAVRTAKIIKAPKVINTIVRGQALPGWWQPTCDGANYCGEQGQAAFWPAGSVCNAVGDYRGDEADKMAVDPRGDVYIIDDRYRVAKIDGQTNKVVNVLEIDGFECPIPEGPEGSAEIQTRNTANNIAFSAPGNGVALGEPTAWTLYVTSEQDSVTVINPIKMTVTKTIAIPGASHLDAITVDPELNRVYITDEAGGLWIFGRPKL